MTKKLEIYKCRVCSNVIEVVHEGEGTLVCCKEDMELLKENIPEPENPHYAYVEELDDMLKKVTLKHVMTHEHHIEYVEVISNDGKFLKRKYFEETEPLEFLFRCECKEGFYVRLYCNLDNVWITRAK